MGGNLIMNTAQHTSVQHTSVLEILQECQSVGLVLEIRAGRLKFGYPANLATEKSRLVQIIEHLKAHKAELIKQLSSGGLQEPNLPLDQLREWKAKIEALPPANNKDGATHECAKLVKIALAFLESPHAAKAVSYGWDSLELFGVLDAPHRAAQRRFDAMGLVPSMAWSKIRGFMTELEQDKAIFSFKGGCQKTSSTHQCAKLIKTRTITSRYCSVPFWESSFLIGRE